MQENLISQLSNIKNKTSTANNITTLVAYISMLPASFSSWLGGGATLLYSKTEDLPDKIKTEYFFVLQWKDENCRTLGSKSL